MGESQGQDLDLTKIYGFPSAFAIRAQVSFHLLFKSSPSTLRIQMLPKGSLDADHASRTIRGLTKASL